jgi:hypothetical protein
VVTFLRYPSLLLLSMLSVCSVVHGYTVEMIEKLFPEKPENGIEFDSIEYITPEALNDLVREVTEYHYGFSCTEYDTISLLAPDGEYRAIVVLFSLNPELEDSYSFFLELVKNQVFYAHQWWLTKDDELAAQLKEIMLKYDALLDSYYCFVVASIGNELIPVCIISNTNIEIIESNFTKKNHTFMGFGLLPRVYSFNSDCAFKYEIIAIEEDEDGNVFWGYAPESLIRSETWLLYVPSTYTWKDWEVKSNHWWPIGFTQSDFEKSFDSDYNLFNVGE